MWSKQKAYRFCLGTRPTQPFLPDGCKTSLQVDVSATHECGRTCRAPEHKTSEHVMQWQSLALRVADNPQKTCCGIATAPMPVVQDIGARRHANQQVSAGVSWLWFPLACASRDWLFLERRGNSPLPCRAMHPSTPYSSMLETHGPKARGTQPSLREF